MKHPDAEDYGRLLEGNISPDERLRLLEHMSQCRRCRTIYSEAADFLEGIGENRVMRLVPGGLNRRRILWVAASVIIIVLLGLFILIESPGSGIERVQKQFIAQRYKQLENVYHSSFASDGNREFSAVRIGIFSRDLSLVVDGAGDRKLRETLQKMLRSQLKLFIDAGAPVMKQLDDGLIREIMDKESLAPLYRLGRFLEESLLATYEEKLPDRTGIATYRQIATQHGLPRGVLKGLNKLETVNATKECRNICNELLEIFFE